jgi:uncharacterized protein (TIGR02284 family)
MHDDAKSLINELIETSKDGEKGFAKAANDTTDAHLRGIFVECAQRCRTGASELQEQVRALGGKPETGGSVMGAVHRGWLEIKAAVASRDAKAILEECERGEDYAKARYADALKKELPIAVREVLQRQYQGVVSNHDRIRSLRDQYKGV